MAMRLYDVLEQEDEEPWDDDELDKAIQSGEFNSYLHPDDPQHKYKNYRSKTASEANSSPRLETIRPLTVSVQNSLLQRSVQNSLPQGVQPRNTHTPVQQTTYQERNLGHARVLESTEAPKISDTTRQDNNLDHRQYERRPTFVPGDVQNQTRDPMMGYARDVENATSFQEPHYSLNERLPKEDTTISESEP